MSKNKVKPDKKARTTVGIKHGTKSRLDANRAPGQCYDGFLQQTVNLWERSRSGRLAPTRG